MRERTDKKYCDKRGVWLYKNPEYHSDEEDETAIADSWSRKLDVTEPKAKRPKPDGPKIPPGGTKTLTDPQRARLGKGSAAIIKERASLDEVMKVFDGVAAEYLPVPTKKKVDIATKLAEVVLADLAMAADPSWAGSFADLISRMNEAKTQLQNTTRTVKVYAEEAKTETAQGDP